MLARAALLRYHRLKQRADLARATTAATHAVKVADAPEDAALANVLFGQCMFEAHQAGQPGTLEVAERAASTAMSLTGPATPVYTAALVLLSRVRQARVTRGR